MTTKSQRLAGRPADLTPVAQLWTTACVMGAVLYASLRFDAQPPFLIVCVVLPSALGALVSMVSLLAVKALVRRSGSARGSLDA